MTYTADQLRHQAMLFERSELNNEAAMLRAGADAMEKCNRFPAILTEEVNELEVNIQRIVDDSIKQARNQALEEAAALIENNMLVDAVTYAAAIRALKEKNDD